MTVLIFSYRPGDHQAKMESGLVVKAPSSSNTEGRLKTNISNGEYLERPWHPTPRRCPERGRMSRSEGS